MRWPIVLLAVPAALLGLAAYAPGFRTALELEEPHLSVAIVLPLVLLALGAAGAWWLWREMAEGDPAAALGRARPFLAAGFRLDAVQDRLVVRPVRGLAGLVRTGDERVVDATVEGAGTTTSRLGELLAAAHRIPLPWAATLVLGGALVLTLWFGAAS
jgi:NADH-quinone oxidoreductase subunit L